MSDSPAPTSPRDSSGPSTTNQQCKVCTSPDRFEIEVALARGRSQASVATRFSRDGQAFNRQNINTHYHKHMEVLDRAVAEEAAKRGLSRSLDLKQAAELQAEHERNRAQLRAQVHARINEGLEWKTRDLLAFMEQDIRLEEQRNQLRIEPVLIQVDALAQAVRRVVPQELWTPIIDAYDEILNQKQVEDFLFHEELAASSEEKTEEASEA
jgi:hypothetical protein